MKRSLFLAATFLGALAALAQAPPKSAPKTIVLKAARMFDGRSDRLVSPAVVVVEDGKIADVGGAVPAGAEVIDLGDATILPGFIDSHVHLAMEGSDNWFADFYSNVMRFPAEQAHY